MAPSCQLRGRGCLFLIVASILVAGSASHYRVELTHVDANGGFTRGELIRRAVHRTHLRAAMLSATDSAPASSTAYAAAHYSENEYLVDLEMGTPPQRFQAVLDTGSNIVLLTNLSVCNTTSTSFIHPNNCPQSAEPTALSTTCCGGLFMFQRTYGGSRTMQGFMGSETMSFISAATSTPSPIPQKVLVGCTIKTHCGGVVCSTRGLPINASGILGLGRGPYSLIQQITEYHHKFSYCLNHPLQTGLNQAKKNDLKSQLLLGDGPPLATTGSESKLHTTEFTHTIKDPSNSKYYVKLCSISIGSFQLDKKCKVDMLVDSGTSYTYLQPDDFDEVEKQVAELFNKPASNDMELSCYPANELKKSEEPKPAMILNFKGNAEMRLPWNSYMTEYKSYLCLTVLRNTKNEMVILGNFQQQNMKMFYDLKKKELSFQPADCNN